MKRLLIALIACLLAPLCVGAQTAVRFALERRDDGHYYFEAPIGGKKTWIMLESGIPALLVGSTFYQEQLKNSDLEFEESKARMHLMNQNHNILYQANGRVPVGAVVYDGPIFVLDEFSGISLPIQFLRPANDGKHVVTVNIPESYFSVGGPLQRQGTKFKLNYEINTHRPFINASFTINGAKFDGKLLVDLGNPMFLFLFSQHRSVHNAIVRRQVQLKYAYNAQGQRVSAGFEAPSLTFYGKEYKNLIIGVTSQYKNASEMGFLGIPFFDAPVVFDFTDGWMYKMDAH